MKKPAPKPSSINESELEYSPLKDNLYSTSDISFCAFLKANYSAKIVETSKDANGRYSWLLNLGQLNAHDLFQRYLDGEQVSCIVFKNELKNLKERIYGC